jgi:hypothetical protein
MANLFLLRYGVVWHKLRLVRFDIARLRFGNKPVHFASLSKMSAIIEAFIHFCFDIDGITKVLPGEPFLLMNMSTLQRAELLMEMSTHSTGA